jgi:hypothetical protein
VEYYHFEKIMCSKKEKEPEPEEQGSAVARLRSELEAEYESAKLGLQGLACGTSRHKFLKKKMDRVGRIADELKKFVGEDETVKLLSEMNDQLAGEDPKGETDSDKP